MNQQEIYFQSEGHTGTKVIELEINATVHYLTEGAKSQGVILHEDVLLFIENTEVAFVVAEVSERLLSDLGIGHGSKIHFHRSRCIEVTVKYESESHSHSFLPATTIQQIKHWAVDAFKVDASVEVDHGLKVCGQTTFLPENTHVGSLAHKDCEVCLVLAPKRPVQG